MGTEDAMPARGEQRPRYPRLTAGRVILYAVLTLGGFACVLPFLSMARNLQAFIVI